jgi:hypothetical protein
VSKCLATITLGSSEMWEAYFRDSWEDYANRHGYDIVRITEPPDPDDDRQPHWQKLLVLENPDVAEYDHVVWLDHDIFITPHAPCIVDAMKTDRVGAVTWQGSYHADPAYLDHAFRPSWRRSGLKWIKEEIHSFEDILTRLGYPPCNDWMNTGVMVLRPDHSHLLNKIYEIGLGGPDTSAEMVAVIHHMLGSGQDLVEPIDRRFNAIWYLDIAMHYPFILNSWETAAMCWETELANNYFVHCCNGATRKLACSILDRKPQLV